MNCKEKDCDGHMIARFVDSLMYFQCVKCDSHVRIEPRCDQVTEWARLWLMQYGEDNQRLAELERRIKIHFDWHLNTLVNEIDKLEIESTCYSCEYCIPLSGSCTWHNLPLRDVEERGGNCAAHTNRIKKMKERIKNKPNTIYG